MNKGGVILCCRFETIDRRSRPVQGSEKVMGDCRDFDLFPVLNYNKVDPLLWAYWTSSGNFLFFKKPFCIVCFGRMAWRGLTFFFFVSDRLPGAWFDLEMEMFIVSCCYFCLLFSKSVKGWLTEKNRALARLLFSMLSLNRDDDAEFWFFWASRWKLLKAWKKEKNPLRRTLMKRNIGSSRQFQPGLISCLLFLSIFRAMASYYGTWWGDWTG